MAAIRELARIDGLEDPRVHRIAEATGFFTPRKPRAQPTPLDERIAEAEAELTRAQGAYDRAAAARRAAPAKLQRVTRKRAAKVRTQAEALAIFENADALLSGSEVVVDFYQADAALLRALARRNALVVARDRWRANAEARYHDLDRPGEALTSAELVKLREREGD